MTISLILAAAAGFADLNALDAAVARFAGAPIGAEGGAVTPLDRRLRLTPCRSPAALSWRGERRETIVVECPDNGGWRLFVPVRALSGGGGLGRWLQRVAARRGDGRRAGWRMDQSARSGRKVSSHAGASYPARAGFRSRALKGFAGWAAKFRRCTP
jgi:hypothetical protein